jgi:hypothetical protein
MGANQSARTVFGSKLREAGRALRERPEGSNGAGIVGVEDDDEQSDEE